MGDWPTPLAAPPRNVISTDGPDSVGGLWMAGNWSQSTSTTTVWPSANRGYFVPCVLSNPFYVARFFVSNGSVVSGNLDIGLFTSEGRKLVSTGATLQAGTSTIQNVVASTPTWVGPGVYYLGLAVDNGTGRVEAWVNGTVAWMQMCGIKIMASAYSSGLVATATYATVSGSSVFLPIFGMSSDSVAI